MSSSIDPPRRTGPLRRTRKSVDQGRDEASGAEAANLPVPVTPAATVPPGGPAVDRVTIAAQLIGERRGLRGGASVIDAAKATYNKVEWSGAKDRRRPKGKVAKTEI